MSVLVIGQFLPDPFPAFLSLVCGTENYTSQTPPPAGIWRGPANQGQWKKVEEKPGYFFPLSVSSQVSAASVSPLWLLLNSPGQGQFPLAGRRWFQLLCGGPSSWAPGTLPSPPSRRRWLPAVANLWGVLPLLLLYNQIPDLNPSGRKA